MPVPPPPPPPLAPPPSVAPPLFPLEAPKVHTSGGGGRSALLADIQKGARLKKVTHVNDRSAPVVDKPKASGGDVSSNVGAAQGPCGGAPSLGGLFAAGFPTLRPVGQRESAGKTPVSRSSSSASLKPLWNTPTLADLIGPRPLASSSAPPSPTHASKHLAPLPVVAPAPPTPPAPPSAPLPPPPPPLIFQDRPANKPPPLPSCPPPPPPFHGTKPTWLPIQHYQHTPSAKPLTPPPPTYNPPSLPGDRSSWSFFPPPPHVVHSEPARFPILRDSSPLGPPPPPLPSFYTPSFPSNLPPPPPRIPAVPSPALRFLPPSYPCNAPTRRPPAVPRSAGVSRLAPPPAPPARSPATELSSRIPPPPPPPPPPLPPSSVRNGHLHSLDDFESKFQFHPMEDFPPPDEFKPFPRIYPSKENRVNSAPHGIRSHLR
ncbi:WAS/WASL-interacting protein family member 3 [Syngnathus acus]|uniref:WAS/WASL-interacting protein family member 3 n=1 Tax=Syngnathus acus TaxID=161584 RepID=UPI001885D0C6|nr:WAS/WASL-interacting protein family member 3 [Syngnathus acus]XP_037119459.1 WAS/WASL-interacting protein family member 3 [Syngnathus acus]